MRNRLLGLAGVGLRRLWGRLRSGNRRRVLLSVTGVALAIALLVVVSGISLGLASSNTVYGSGVDYWVVPESASASTMAIDVGSAQFGAVHPTAERIAGIDGVSSATPVRTSLVRLQSGNTSEYVVLLGVIPQAGVSVAGLSTGNLTPGDPYYANGSYNGTWTGDAALSEGAASLLNATNGSTLGVAGQANASFTVVGVQRASASSGAGQVPVGLVHLAELQAITGGTASDTADQFVVATNTPAVKDDLAAVYPHSRVVANDQGSLAAIGTSKLALAIALTAFVVAIVIGTLFVGTALGLEVAADRSTYATLLALGLPARSLGVVVATQAVAVTLLGGLLGLLLGGGGVLAANALAQQYLTDSAIAAYPLVFVPYGLGTAVAVGLLATPYLVWLVTRTDVLDHLATE
ncbi:FtsX-like permease family protein [Halarchaeum sp. P4]|uniref:FtsX-like permease family protein n=1 Tax=Halarchaeum sp. P4 TaxID=3421639 RepID=UPI003EBC331D